MTAETELENAILGEVLTGGSPELDSQIFLDLTEDHFAEPKNRTAYGILKAMRSGGRPINPLTFRYEAEGQGQKDLNDKYIQSLMDHITTPAHTQAYIALVKRNAYMREIRRQIMRLNPSADRGEVERVMELVALRDSADKKLTVTPKDIADQYITELKEKNNQTIETGFDTIDRNIHPQAGDLIVVGARTNVGKTTYLTNVCVNMLENGIPCLYAPTEMRPKQFLDRISPLVSDIPAHKFRSREFELSELAEMDQIAGRLKALPFTMLDIAGPNIAEITQAVRSSGCKVLFLDYLGRCSMPRETTRMREIEKFVVELKNLCVTEGVLCFLAVQLSRATDFNKDSPPRLADLSDSSAIEKEADAVIFLWRDPANPTGGIIQAGISKNRHGNLCGLSVAFDKNQMKMTEESLRPTNAYEERVIAP